MCEKLCEIPVKSEKKITWFSHELHILFTGFLPVVKCAQKEQQEYKDTDWEDLYHRNQLPSLLCR